VRCPDATEIADFSARILEGERVPLVESHVADCSECRALVFAMADESHAEPRACIGRFEIEDIIGRGAMGVVYRAHDPELDRKVAIKVHAGAFDLAGEERLRREAQALARLNRPNVVAVYEAGRHEDSTYVAMELVDGLTLDEWMRQPHDPSEIVDAFVQAGHGLAAAHAAGLVHRDIKPRNVFVCSATGVVKIGDFGLVRTGRREASLDECTHEVARSNAGLLVGTPAYMAPEQLRGEPATEASDQFSFCAMLYEATYGVRPFAGTTVCELVAAMATPVVLPRTRRIPRSVRTVLERGLRALPSERFASMAALLDVLAPRPRARWPWLLVPVALLAGLSFVAFMRGDAADLCDVEDPSAARSFASSRLEQVESALSASGLSGAKEIATRVTRELVAYKARWNEASSAVCRATAARSQSAALGDRQRACLERSLLRATDLLELMTDASTASKALDATLALPEPETCTLVDRHDDIDPPSPTLAGPVAALERTLEYARSLVALGRHQAARAQVGPALEHARRLGYSPLLATALNVAAEVAAEASGELAEREALLEEALREAAKARDDLALADIHVDMMFLLGIDGERFGDALQWARSADAAITRAGNPRGLRWSLQVHRASILGRHGKIDEAVRVLEAALASRANDERSLEQADAHTALGGLLATRGMVDRTYAHFLAALASYRQVYRTDDHPKMVVALSNLGMAHLMNGDVGAARAFLERARLATERVHGVQHVGYSVIVGALAETERKLGNNVAAMNLHRQAYAIVEAKLGRTHPTTAIALANLSGFLAEAGELDEALRGYGEAIETTSRAYGAKHDTLAAIRIGYGTALGRASQPGAARRELRTALAILEANGNGPGSVYVTKARAQLEKITAVRSSRRARP
jgi:tetratricopeptide (TPR) repeat protein